tara:strand:+ start:4166 stop:4456 length:291 start_codon:yes stop_codon:yes gene_type:complete
LLPAAAVKELVEERAAEMEKASGSPLRQAEKKLLKEQVYEELLPTALKRTGHFLVAIDIKRNWILVDAASRKKAERKPKRLLTCCVSRWGRSRSRH